MEETDYSDYSLEELYDVERNIDAEMYPAKYRQILEQISIKRTETTAIDSTSIESTHDNLTGQTSFMENPVAQKTNWSPLVTGGSNFATHVLDDSSRSQIRFKPSVGLYLFTLLFSGVSFISFFKMENMLVDSGEWPTSFDQYMQTFIPFIFVGASLYLIFRLFEKIIFDKRRGIYWKGRKQPSRLEKIRNLKNSTDLDQIYAIQLITELIDDDDSDYYSFELNLVLKNGERMAVVDHGNQERIRDNAFVLGKFLNVPVWEHEQQSERNSFFSVFGMKV